jgi:hypothetical protein
MASPHPRRTRLAVGLAVASLVARRDASAAEPGDAAPPPAVAPPAVTAGLSVVAPDGCVSDAAVRTSLASHGLALAPDRTPRPAEWPVVQLRIEPAQAGGYRGVLRIDRPGVEATERHVDGTRCDEIEDALALMAAMALEDEASPAAPAPPDQAPAAQPPPTDEELADDLPPSDVRPAPVTSRDHLARAGVQGSVLALDAPSATPALGIFAELTGPLAGARRSLRATFAYERVSVPVQPATLALTWWTGRLDLCPFVLAVGAGFDASPCFAWEMGVLDESAANATRATPSSKPWLAPGTVARMGWSASFVHLELQASLLVPLERSEFLFEPGPVTGYRAPAIVPSAAFGLGIDFL